MALLLDPRSCWQLLLLQLSALPCERFSCEAESLSVASVELHSVLKSTSTVVVWRVGGSAASKLVELPTCCPLLDGPCSAAAVTARVAHACTAWPGPERHWTSTSSAPPAHTFCTCVCWQ
jgi:hypothetical protein